MGQTVAAGSGKRVPFIFLLPVFTFISQKHINEKIIFPSFHLKKFTFMAVFTKILSKKKTYEFLRL
jgi:hypothetical protein